MVTPPKQTPLVDLLRGVPLDARIVYGISPAHSRVIPVGRLCAEAAAAIAEDAETIANLVRALREEVDSPTFMGEPVIAAVSAPAQPVAQWWELKSPAMVRFNECVLPEDKPMSPLERLRAFCSFAMSPQDWIDVEPFFDALEAPAQPADRG